MNTDYPVPVQVDGEPWLQPPCDITIIRSALKVKVHHRLSPNLIIGVSLSGNHASKT